MVDCALYYMVFFWIRKEDGFFMNHCITVDSALLEVLYLLSSLFRATTTVG